jgi:two-component system CheB/CheR fusion protein
LGIGQALVDELARAHGGRVEAQSAGIGHGTTFIVTLPVQRPASAPEPMAPASHFGLSGARILAVDDDEESLDFRHAPPIRRGRG